MLFIIGQVVVAADFGEVGRVGVLDLERLIVQFQFTLCHQSVQADSHMPLRLTHALLVIE